jgi:hypothetical protein
MFLTIFACFCRVLQVFASRSALVRIKPKTWRHAANASRLHPKSSIPVESARPKYTKNAMVHAAQRITSARALWSSLETDKK